MKERKIYLTNADVQYIYEDLLAEGLYEYFITLKIIDEIQIDYTFLSKLTWKDIIESETIIDVTGYKEKEYFINDHIKEEAIKIANILTIEDTNDKIIRTPARDLFKYLGKYERIKHYKAHSVFRIDYFREHSVDINGVKTYMLRTIEDKEEYNPNEDNISKCFLYVAVLDDKFKEQRPEPFKTTVCFDKKIGISKVIENRMNDLSKDKKHGGTLSPIYVKALRAWVMPTKLCRDLEREFHETFNDRNTEGEWFTDYYEDLIKLVEKRIRKLKKDGNPIVKVDINEDNEDVTYTYRLSKSFLEQNATNDEFIPKIRYEI